MPTESWSYAKAGVDINAGNEAVRRIKPLVQGTMRPEVLSGIGGFAGLFALAEGKYRRPVLVSGCDGVGTKLKVAFAVDKHDTVGIDCVAMCVNDILVLGAEPLFFLDYLAVGRLMPEQVAVSYTHLDVYKRQSLNFGNPEKPEVYWQLQKAIEGMAAACRALEIPVVGGNVSLYNEIEGQAIFPVSYTHLQQKKPPGWLFYFMGSAETVML